MDDRIAAILPHGELRAQGGCCFIYIPVHKLGRPANEGYYLRLELLGAGVITAAICWMFDAPEAQPRCLSDWDDLIEVVEGAHLP